MKKRNNRTTIDGFIPRRPGSQLGDKHLSEQEAPIDRNLHTTENTNTRRLGEARQGKLIQQDELAASLRELDSIDDETNGKKGKRLRRHRKDRVKRPLSKPKKIILAVVIALLLIGLGIGGYVVWKAVVAGNNVLEGSVFDLVQNKPLQEDANGRSNFVIFGTAEDDEGGTHDGANLTDSIMVISIDQDKKDAYMLSIPRDLWVEHGQWCSVGYQEKINTVYLCASEDGKNEDAGAKALAKKVGEVTGLDIQYYVHLNFTAVTQAVDAVGGVDVKIESNPPGVGILDRNFDWKCNYTCYYVKYNDGETVHLDGEHALALARARNVNPGSYGLAAGNFDREKNQQKIIQALLEKAVSAGTLTNLGAVTGLIDALGNNLRTNVQTKEVRTLMSLGTEIKPENIIRLSLVNEDEPLVTTGMYLGRSIVRPIAGLLDYSAIAAYVDENVNSTPISREKPKVMVMNGGAAAGVASTEADKLTELGYKILSVENVPSGKYSGVTVYQMTEAKPASGAKLQELYGVTLNTNQPPFSVVGEADFVVIIGASQ